MLTLYRRHLEDTGDTARCLSKLKSRGMTAREIRAWNRCGCPIWIIGTDPRGVFHRHTLNTANWTVAERPRVEINSALESWKTALLAAKRGERTIKAVHGAMTKSLVDWCAATGY